MKKSIAALILTTATFSGAALADFQHELTLDVSPQKGGAWVVVEKAGQPQAGATVTILGDTTQSYVTTDNGRIFVHSNVESARSLTFKATDDDGNSVSAQRLIPSNRS
ncbi:hypothetical protein BIT28_06275 [Photobacterium proteolyticum]|uniref:Uncharacterized protein n=1 Tax=Photobacterium proteolyticum TaxID=1903952 RepID=A0A1Q9GF11_9GAMM|nr:hypothetical protein [Photobacterium proteolyticum]OLQ72998.1 hypothetical protein BIT28_06275 [Photobacterium proteolyticum]